MSSWLITVIKMTCNLNKTRNKKKKLMELIWKKSFFNDYEMNDDEGGEQQDVYKIINKNYVSLPFFDAILYLSAHKVQV